METDSPSSFYDLSKMKTDGAKTYNNSSSQDGMVSVSVNKVNIGEGLSFESTTDLEPGEDDNRNVVGYEGKYVANTLPQPLSSPSSARPNGILKNAGSLPRDLSMQMPNEIHNPLFMGEMYEIDYEKTVLNTVQDDEGPLQNDSTDSSADDQLPNGTSLSLQRARDLSLKKKVSFSENVVYTADLKSDIVINPSEETGQVEEHLESESKVVEADKEDHYDLIGVENDAPNSYSQSSMDTLESQPSSVTGPQGYALRVDEYELRNGRLWRNLDGQGSREDLDDGGKKGKEFKYAVCVAVVWVVAVAGIVILGALLGVTISWREEGIDVDDVASSLSLEEVDDSLFIDSKSGVPLESATTDSVKNYVISNRAVMTWRKWPASDIYLLWHGGASIEVVSLKEDGSLETRYLGDPTETEDATYTLLLSKRAWHAAEVFDNDDNVVISILFPLGEEVASEAEDAISLSLEYPILRDIILQYDQPSS